MFMRTMQKQRRATFVSETLQNEMHACKAREDKKSKALLASKMRLTRSEFAKFEAMKG